MNEHDPDQRNEHRPIVCGTDFSPAAFEAVETAAALARSFQTRLVLVYVEEFHGLAGFDPGLFEGALTVFEQGDMEHTCGP
jgi:Universal stress protein family.